MNFMTAPHLDHDTSMGHSIGIIAVIAVIMLLLLYLFGGSDKK